GLHPRRLTFGRSPPITRWARRMGTRADKRGGTVGKRTNRPAPSRAGRLALRALIGIAVLAGVVLAGRATAGATSPSKPDAAFGAGYPPDTVGDVGPNHYVQAVNTAFGVFSKTGTQLVASTLDALWSGAGTGTSCDTEHSGDPTVVYDPLGDRWIVADFSLPSYPSPPFYECIAVSRTSNPVSGGWYM